MIKVFLVEDEAIIRRGIRDNIDWNANGFEFAGEAGDGEYAYPLILKTEPDILLTDVKMPFMDGLELSRLVKRPCPRQRLLSSAVTMNLTMQRKPSRLESAIIF